jgi:hypothetical protein
MSIAVHYLFTKYFPSSFPTLKIVLDKTIKTVNFLIQETGLTKDECEAAYDFYNGIKLP